jgi:FixJ family two-component response regulator
VPESRTGLGAALRPTNRRAEAREHLQQAVELATICGATALAERASTSARHGARPRRVALAVASLAPAERRIAEMAAEGPTREIAQTLFITQRTVGVTSPASTGSSRSPRSQLAAALTDAAPS